MQFHKKFVVHLVRYGRLGYFSEPNWGNRSFCQLQHRICQKKFVALRCLSVKTLLYRGNVLLSSQCLVLQRPVHGVQSTVPDAKYPSALFVSGSAQRSSEVDIDLDLDERMNSIEDLYSNAKLRRLDLNIDNLVESYRHYKRLQPVKLKLEEEREDIAKRIAILVKAEQTEDIQNSRSVLMKRGKEVKEELKSLMITWRNVEEEVMLTALKLPNVLHPRTPDKDAEILQEIHQTAKPATDVCHWDIGKKLDWIKFSNVGPRAFYLKGKLALLEQALISYFTQRLEQQEFLQLKCPEFFRSLVVEGCGENYIDPDQIYRLQSSEVDNASVKPRSGYHLRGISPLSFAAYLTKMNIDLKTLPQKYFAVGRSYVPSGSLKDQHLPGLYGALQSVKAELCGVCGDINESHMMFSSFYTCVLDLYKVFNLPLRVVLLPASALLPREQLRHDIQMWAPGCSDYITVSSISLTGDYISRRLMITHSSDIESRQHAKHYVQLVHAEVMDVSRLIGIIMESGDFTNQSYKLPELPVLDDHWL